MSEDRPAHPDDPSTSPTPAASSDEAQSGQDNAVENGEGATSQAAETEGAAAQRAKKPSGRKKARRKAPPKKHEPEPVLSGRLVTAAAFLAGMALIPVSGIGNLITKEAPKTAERATWQVGEKATIHLTVVTSDYKDLACADEKSIDGLHCEFKNDREKFPKEDDSQPLDDNKATILQPYRTTDSNLLLTAGLWAQPDVATRLHFEPSRGVSKDKLARFVVSCQVEFLAEWENPQIRWKSSDRWGQNGKAMVTKLLDCAILEDSKS